MREGSPIALDDESEPEADVIVVPGRQRDYARAGVADYWIVNLRRRVLEVCREPVAMPSARFGWKYRRVRILKARATVIPLAAPSATIAVADLLP